MPNLTHCAGCGRQLSDSEKGCTHCRGCQRSILAGRGALPRKYGSILDTPPAKPRRVKDPNQTKMEL